MTSPVQTILMCPPDHFEVTYVINPWMEGQVAKTDKILARRQWDGLRNALARHAEVVLQSPQPGLPDLVFTANAGLVAGTKVIVSRFRAAQRQGEEPHYRAWFEANGFELLDWPTEFPFEGAGDALFDRGEDLLWVGHGFRSHPASSALLERMLGCRTAPLDLVDPRFYHLDTCLCPLASGHLLYYPPAFAELVARPDQVAGSSQQTDRRGRGGRLAILLQRHRTGRSCLHEQCVAGTAKTVAPRRLHPGDRADVGIPEIQRRRQMPHADLVERRLAA